MRTIEYAAELDPLLELSPPANWFVAVVPDPSQLLLNSELPEDRLFGELLSGGDGSGVVATRLGFLYYRGFDPDRRTPPRGNQVSVNYDPENGQFELSSELAETTVQTADAAAEWVANQFAGVENFVDTYLVLIDLAEDVDGLGKAGVRGLAEAFETLDAIRDADVDAVAGVPYVDEVNARALQNALEDVDAVDDDDPTPLERELRAVDGPLIFDLQEGPIPGALVPSGASEPTYRSEGLGDAVRTNTDG